MRNAVLLSLVVLLCGCSTHLSTSADLKTENRKLATVGVPYSLPMLQYELTITHALAQCYEPGADGKPTATPMVKFITKVDATPHYIAGETYVVDYEALASFTKITSMTLDYHEAGTLKSINAAAEDKSAEMIGSLIKSAVGIVSIAGGIPIPLAAWPPADGKPAPMPKTLECDPKTQKLLDVIDSQTVNLKSANKTLEALTDQVDALTERVAANAISDDDKSKLSDLIDEQRVATLAVSAAQAKLDKAQNVVTSTIHIRWPSSFEQDHDEFPLDERGASKLAALVVLVDAAGGANDSENECGIVEPNLESRKSCLIKKLGVNVNLDSLAKFSVTKAEPAQEINPAHTQPGIFVRPPLRGRLLVCHQSDTSCGQDAKTLLLRTDDAVIPQLGQLRFLPFKNGIFQNNALSVVLRADGSLEKVEYKDLKARGELAAATLADAVGQVGAFADARRAKRESDDADAKAAIVADRTAKIDDLKYQIELITKQNELQALTEPPTTSALAIVQAETTQTNARVALYQAQLAERNALAALRGAP